MTNVSYERGIIVLSFPDISFVILPSIFQKFEIKSGFPFFITHTVYTLNLISIEQSDTIQNMHGHNNLCARNAQAQRAHIHSVRAHHDTSPQRKKRK